MYEDQGKSHWLCWLIVLFQRGKMSFVFLTSVLTNEVFGQLLQLFCILMEQNFYVPSASPILIIFIWSKFSVQ